MHLRSDLAKKDRAPAEHIHEVMFAVQLLNMDQLEEVLLDVSNPNSDNYGKYMTKDQITSLTSNPEANDAIKNHLIEIGAKFISETHGGEYISAQGPVKMWEKLFNTEFYVFHHTHAVDTNGVDQFQKVVRAEKYSVPLALNDYVSSVFYTIQMPLVVRGLPIVSPIDPTDFLNGDINGNVGGNDDGNSSYTSNVHINAANGFITPSLLKSFYNVGGALGSDLSTQSVYETLTQYYAPSDLFKFQRQFGVSTTGTVINIGDHSSETACVADKNDCIEGNLDIQYMMATAQNAPTTYWWIDPANSFAQWLQLVSNMQNPPFVFSIR